MKVFTLGEIMMRLTPENCKRFVQADKFDVTFGGAEANVAVALSQRGIKSSVITKLPQHDMGQAAVNSLRKYGVDTDLIVRDGARIGLYYCEKGASQRASKVIYDRAESAFAMADPDEFAFDKIFSKGDVLHVSGITPALGDKAMKVTFKALECAKKAGCMISFDVNYRSKLWSVQYAAETVAKILPYVDVFIANENQISEVVGIQSPFPVPDDDSYVPETNLFMAESLTKKFGYKVVAITSRRTISSEVNTFRSMVYMDGKAAFSRDYKIIINDRIGSGDAFAAGVLYGFINSYNAEKTAYFATAAAALAHSVEGDYSLLSVGEINALINSGTAKVQR